MNWKIVGGVAVVAVIALVLFGVRQSSAPAPETIGESEGVTAPTAENNAPAATEPTTVDSVVDSVLADAAQDQALTQAEDANANVAIQDTADLNDLGAAYNGDEF
ncbi:MAG: hypothetical protein RL681_539 [Candidatus Parcubacteria bacterium]|jgi:hypothetical protein